MSKTYLRKFNSLLRRFANINLVDAVFFLLLSSHLLVNLIWISLDKAPYSWDEAHHLVTSNTYFRLFSTGGSDIYTFLTISGYYPPLVYIIIALCTLFTNSIIPTSRVVITIIFLIGLTYMYKLVKLHFSKTSFIPLITVAIFSFIYSVTSLSRMVMLEVPLITMIIICIYAYQKLAKLNTKKGSIILGIIFGLGLLTKWTFAPFAGIYIISESVLSGITYKKFTNGLIAIALSLIISLPWYVANLPTLMPSTQVSATAERGDAIGFNISTLTNYLNVLLEQFGLYVLIIVFLGIFYLRKKNLKYLIPLLISIMMLYMIFTVIPNKNTRYILPLGVYLFLLFAYGLEFIFLHKKLLFYFISLVIISIYSTEYASLSFIKPIFKVYEEYSIDMSLPILRPIKLFNLTKGDNLTIFDQKDWFNKQIFDDIHNTSDRSSKKNLLVLVEKMHISPTSLDFSMLRYKISDIVLWSASTDINISEMNYILIPETSFGALLPQYANDLSISDQNVGMRGYELYTGLKEESFKGISDGKFEIIRTYQLNDPIKDVDKVFLLKRISSI